MIIKRIIKVLLYIFICLFIVAPAVIIIMFYYNKNTIFNGAPSYLVAVMIALVFAAFSFNTRPVLDRIFRRTKYPFEEMPGLIKDISYITSVEDIIVRIVDILFESFSVEYISAMLPDKEAQTLKKYFSKGSDPGIGPIGIESPVIKWLVENKQVLDIHRFYKNKKNNPDIREDINKIFMGKNAGLILPLCHEEMATGIICIGPKNNGSRFSKDEISRLRVFIENCNLSIRNSMDYEDWSRQQLLSGVLDLSSEILSKSVPEHLPKSSGISFGAFYIPRYREGIDYFDFITPTNFGAGVIATHIAGRGINNAIYSVILRSAFHACIEEAHSTFTIIQRLNKALYSYTKGKAGIVKAYYFYYDISARRLTFTNAGYEPLEIYRVDKNVFESLDTEGLPLGSEINSNFGMGRINLVTGDIGFLYSKALTESKNNNGEKFGLTQLRRIIKENRQRHPNEIVGTVREIFTSFMGSSSPVSNILVIVFKV